MTSAINNSTLSPAQALLMMQQRTNQNSLVNDLNQDSSPQNAPVSLTAPSLTGGGSPLSSDILSLLVQSQGVTQSDASAASGAQQTDGHKHDGGGDGGGKGGGADALASLLGGSSSTTSSSSSAQPGTVTEVNADGSVTTVTTNPDGTTTTTTAPASTQADAADSSESNPLEAWLEALQPIG